MYVALLKESGLNHYLYSKQASDETWGNLSQLFKETNIVTEAQDRT